MKVLLLRPITEQSRILPDLGLGYLAAVLRKADHEVVIEDGACPERLTNDGVRGLCRGLKPDVVGFKLLIGESARMIEMTAVIRGLAGKPPLLLAGGPQISGEGAAALDRYPVDYAFVGEAEEGLPRLLELLGDTATPGALAEIPGLIWRDDGTPRSNQPSFPAALDELPMPAWKLIDPRQYPPTPSNMHARAFPVAGLLGSRGCAFDCAFCAAKLTNGRMVRQRSAANIFTEVTRLHREYGVREFEFYDSNFTLHRDLVNEFCMLVRESGLQANFSLPNGVRLDSLDDELVATLAGAGFYLTYLGVESGSPRILKEINKKLDPAVIPDKVALLKRHGFTVGGLFIIGFPGETDEDIEATVQCAVRADFDIAYFQKCTPLPGTEIGRLYEEHFGPIDWAAIDFEPSTWNMTGTLAAVTDEMITQRQKDAYRRFYLRPRILWRLLPRMIAPRYLRYAITRLLKL